MNSQELDDDLWRDWLGRERFNAYLKDAAGRPVTFAVVANQRLSAAILEDCSYLELALRNRLDAALRSRLVMRGISEPWTEDPTGEIQSIGGDLSRRLSQCRVRVSRQKPHYSHSDVLAELTLGFWVAVLSKKAQALRHDLLGVFEGYPSRDFGPLINGLNELRVLRNRVAHHHRVLHRDLERDLLLLARVAKWIDPRLAQFMAKESRVQALIQRFEQRS